MLFRARPDLAVRPVRFWPYQLLDNYTKNPIKKNSRAINKQHTCDYYGEPRVISEFLVLSGLTFRFAGHSLGATPTNQLRFSETAFWPNQGSISIVSAIVV